MVWYLCSTSSPTGIEIVNSYHVEHAVKNDELRKERCQQHHHARRGIRLVKKVGSEREKKWGKDMRELFLQMGPFDHGPEQIESDYKGYQLMREAPQKKTKRHCWYQRRTGLASGIVEATVLHGEQ